MPRRFFTISCLIAALAFAFSTSRESAAGGDAAKGESAACRIEAFGRVVASDPDRMEGTRAARMQEFPAEDLLLSREVARGEDGLFTAPTWSSDGRRRPDAPSCFGLEWDELRLLREVGFELADAAASPLARGVKLQYWTGESAWQGTWKTLDTNPEISGGRVSWRFGGQGQTTQKVRWIFPPVPAPVLLKAFLARTDSVWKTAEIRIESDRPGEGESIPIELYNGFFLNPPKGGSPTQCRFDPAKPLRLTVRYSSGGSYATDRTVLRFRRSEAPFGVAVEDVLANEGVYLPHAGVFVARSGSPVTLDEYCKRIASRRTVLEQVRGLPDQTFAQAVAKVHNPVQDRGPMLASLACDNRKFVAHEDGSVGFRPYGAPDARYEPVGPYPRSYPADLERCQFRSQFGDGKHGRMARHLNGGWLPMPVTTVAQGGLVYRQRTFVAPLGEDRPTGAPRWYHNRAACVVEIDVANPKSKAADASVSLTFVENAEPKKPVAIEKIERGFLATTPGRLMAVVDLGGAGALTAKADSGKITLSGALPAGGKARCTVLLPAWTLTPKEYEPLLEATDWAARCRDYWTSVLASAMRVESPDPFWNNLVRASQVHCMLAARNEAAGARIVPWISADRYEWGVDSEGHAVVRGMDMMGNADFARRCFEFFLHHQRPEGYMTTGYVLVGTGEDLWAWAEHCDRTGDADWVRAAAPKIVRACQWIIRQRQKTMPRDADGAKQPSFGLMTPGVSADWGRFAFRFFNDAQYCAGLRDAGRVLAKIDHPEAAEIREEAARYRRDILHAYRWCQGCSPAIPLANGTWAPAYPTILDCFGHPGMFYPGEDGRRSWAYAVELGGHHLAALDVLDPRSEETRQMIDHMEDVAFLQSGQGDYAEQRNRADFFNLGGFSKLQPYYTRVAELHAQRDDVKPFLRSYFNAIPSLLNRENLSFWEHFHNIGGWNKTHETGWFLCQTRTMLVMERGEELWLAPFVSDQWTKDGMKVAVRNAPTRFGPTSYTITSAAAAGRIEAVVEPPRREPPRSLVLRLRHPDGKRLRAVTVDGKPHQDFDPRQDSIRLKPSSRTMTIVAEY